jgi:hypothetical protein
VCTSFKIAIVETLSEVKLASPLRYLHVRMEPMKAFLKHIATSSSCSVSCEISRGCMHAGACFSVYFSAGVCVLSVECTHALLHSCTAPYTYLYTLRAVR